MSFEVKLWGKRNNGARSAFFTPTDSITVHVEPTHADDNDRALAIAHDCANTAKVTSELRKDVTVREQTIARLERELAAAKAKIPPAEPARILNTGYVRFGTNGELWLLSKRETGWGAFGMRFSSWDMLFRTFNVSVTGHGSDEHGAWWSVENCEASR